MANIRICDMCHQQIEYKKLAFLKFREIYYHVYGETYANDNIINYDLCIPCYNKIKYFIKDPYKFEAEIKLKLKEEEKYMEKK